MAIANCSKEFYDKHMERYKRMSLEDVMMEYDAIVEVLDMDSATNLWCIDELLSWEEIIRDYCLELIRADMDTLSTYLCSGAPRASMINIRKAHQKKPIGADSK